MFYFLNVVNQVKEQGDEWILIKDLTWDTRFDLFTLS